MTHDAKRAPLCFVLIPAGRPDRRGARAVDCDAVYRELVEPAVVRAGLEPLRGGYPFDQTACDHLLLCEYAVADVTAPDADIAYALGLRHGMRPAGLVLIGAQGGGSPAFEPAGLPALTYALTPAGRPARGDGVQQALFERLEAAATAPPRSPLLEIVQDFPDLQRLKTDVFRERVRYSQQRKDQLAAARGEGVAALREVERSLGDLAAAESAVVVDLFLSYRAVKAWDEMIALFQRMAAPLAATVLVREQLGFALNRAGRGAEAERVLREIVAERGPSSETCALLGRVYKDRWEAARAAGTPERAAGALRDAVEAYLAGFESDWRDAFPGINAVTLMEISDPPDPRRAMLAPVVAYAVERRIAAGAPDYWDHATRVEIAVLAGDEAAAGDALADALASVRESWEPESTARNLRLIREARERRGAQPAWASEVESALQACADAGGVAAG